MSMLNTRFRSLAQNHSKECAWKKVGTLSGGERNRVNLAKILKEGANLLLLDEPTNDLDVNTMRALEEALLEFGGSAIVISHDRWFLDRVRPSTSPVYRACYREAVFRF